MSDKFHLKPDGTIGICSASVGKCRYGSIDEHLDSLESAQKMSDFRQEASVDLIKAVNNMDISKLKDNELVMFRKIVVTELEKIKEEELSDNTENILTEEEFQAIKIEADKNVMESGFQEKINELNRLKREFDMKPGYNGVPKGLFDGMKNKRVAKTFATHYFVNSDNSLSVDNFTHLRNRALVIQSMPQYANFQNSLVEYETTALMNVKKYLLVVGGESSLKNEYDRLFKIKYDSLIRNHPKVRRERTKNRALKGEKLDSRRGILSAINKEIVLRKKMKNFGLTNDNIVSRTNVTENANEFVFPFKPKAKNGLMDNVYLYTEKNQLYKIEEVKHDYLSAKDYQGANYHLSYKNDSKIRRKLDVEKDFILIESKSKEKEDYQGLTTLKKN